MQIVILYVDTMVARKPFQIIYLLLKICWFIPATHGPRFCSSITSHLGWNTKSRPTLRFWRGQPRPILMTVSILYYILLFSICQGPASVLVTAAAKVHVIKYFMCRGRGSRVGRVFLISDSALMACHSSYEVHACHHASPRKCLVRTPSPPLPWKLRKKLFGTSLRPINITVNKLRVTRKSSYLYTTVYHAYSIWIKLQKRGSLLFF